jgi:hypothetical protein
VGHSEDRSGVRARVRRSGSRARSRSWSLAEF